MTPPGEPGAAIAVRILDAFDRHPGSPRVLGLSGPQGSGKSTVAAVLQSRLEASGRRTAVLSLDDLYLTRRQRRRLADTVHPLFVTRGPPGTHDLELGREVLDRLSDRRSTALPRFDKSVDDRHPRAAWPIAPAGIDVVIFEGWCLGAQPQAAQALLRPINRLEAQEDAQGVWRTHVNAQLAQGYAALFRRIDVLAYLAPPSFEVVLGWRRQQEAALRRTSGPGSGPGVMDDAALARFVQHYERVTRAMLDDLPDRATLTIRLDGNRQPPERDAGSSRTDFSGVDGS